MPTEVCSLRLSVQFSPLLVKPLMDGIVLAGIRNGFPPPPCVACFS